MKHGWVEMQRLQYANLLCLRIQEQATYKSCILKRWSYLYFEVGARRKCIMTRKQRSSWLVVQKCTRKKYWRFLECSLFKLLLRELPFVFTFLCFTFWHLSLQVQNKNERSRKHDVISAQCHIWIAKCLQRHTDLNTPKLFDRLY